MILNMFRASLVLIFRRTIIYLQYLVSSHSVCCHAVLLPLCQKDITPKRAYDHTHLWAEHHLSIEMTSPV
jgi:hypothetical protein